MKKKAIIILLPALLLMFSCESFIEGWDESPNSPTSTTPALLLTNSEVATFASFTGQNARTAAILTQQCTGVTDQMYDDIQNYNIGENDVDNEWQNIYENSLQTTYTIIKDYSETHPYYTGIAKVIMAMNVGLATDCWGDVPLRESLMGLDGEDYYYPHFDAQQQVIQDIQTMLDEAITLLSSDPAANETSPGFDDIIFGGDVDAWIITAWMLKARNAIHLTKRDANSAATNAMSYLNSAYAAGLASSDDDCNAYFDGSGTAQNQWWAFETNRGGYMRMGEFFIELMKGINDPRLPLFALEVNGDYFGAPMGETNPNDISYVGLYYNQNDATLPLITFVEAKFIEAEAQFRLGNNDDAATAYNEAVIASVEKVTGETIPGSYRTAEASETGASITLDKIMTQKYIALFTQPEVWTDWRRTDIPQLQPYADATGVNSIPRRYPISQSERINNPNAPDQHAITTRVWWDN